MPTDQPGTTITRHSQFINQLRRLVVTPTMDEGSPIRYDHTDASDPSPTGSIGEGIRSSSDISNSPTPASPGTTTGNAASELAEALRRDASEHIGDIVVGTVSNRVQPYPSEPGVANLAMAQTAQGYIPNENPVVEALSQDISRHMEEQIYRTMTSQMHVIKSQEKKFEVPSQELEDMEMTKPCTVCGEHICKCPYPSVTYASALNAVMGQSIGGVIGIP